MTESATAQQQTTPVDESTATNAIDINKALTNRNAQLEKKLKAEMQEQLRAWQSEILPVKLQEVEDKAKARETELLNQIAALNSEKQTFSIKQEIASLTKGKLADDWADIAQERILGSVKRKEDGSPEDLAKDIEAFFKNEANKRFLPAPTKAGNNAKPITSSPIVQTQKQNILTMGEIDISALTR